MPVYHVLHCQACKRLTHHRFNALHHMVEGAKEWVCTTCQERARIEQATTSVRVSPGKIVSKVKFEAK